MDFPREYVSWSAMSCWEQSKTEWIKRYIKNQSTFETGALKLGKKFASEMELGMSIDPTFQFLIDLLPKMEKQEEEIEVFLGKIKLKGKQDMAGETGFAEIKTGSVVWDQKRVNEHGQLDFYALCRTLQGQRIDEIWLHWLPTQNGTLTGEIRSFRRIIVKKDLEMMKKRIKNYIKEVKHYKVLNLKD